jgi:hypothetical protein
MKCASYLCAIPYCHYIPFSLIVVALCATVNGITKTTTTIVLELIFRPAYYISRMTERARKASTPIEVTPAAPEQEPVLANLLELYGHDFSEFQDLDLGPDGRFGYKGLPLYWSEPDRHRFLVTVAGRLAGLVLVKRGSELWGNEIVWDMAEFFVIRGYRRRGNWNLHSA